MAYSKRNLEKYEDVLGEIIHRENLSHALRNSPKFKAAMKRNGERLRKSPKFQAYVKRMVETYRNSPKRRASWKLISEALRNSPKARAAWNDHGEALRRKRPVCTSCKKHVPFNGETVCCRCRGNAKRRNSPRRRD